jgi:hypothetical protein
MPISITGLSLDQVTILRDELVERANQLHDEGQELIRAAPALRVSIEGQSKLRRAQVLERIAQDL